MKVLFHYAAYPPSGSGVGSYMKQMGCALRCNGHESIIVTSRVPGLPEKEETEAGVVYRIYDLAHLCTEAVADNVLAIASRHGVDVIEGADHLGECALILRRKLRPPVMIKYHNCDAIKVVKDSNIFYSWQRLTIALAMWRKRNNISLELESIQKADLACSPSRRLLDEMQLQGFILPKRLAVIPNPIMPAGVGNVDESATPTILFVGSIDFRKGIAFIPNILARIRSKVPNISLEIAGKDTYARGLGSIRNWLTNSFGELLNNVRFLGALGEKEIDDAYRRAWVVVVPSRWDNFPNSVLEAMIRGRSIVASVHGGMPEMLEGTNCIVADPSSPEFAEGIIAFLVNKDKRKLAGKSALNKATLTYGPNMIVKKYVDFLSSAKEIME